MESISRMFTNECLKCQAKQLINLTGKNITDRVIKVQPIHAPPLLLNHMINETTVFICGPLFNLIIELAKMSNAYINEEPKSVEDMIEGMIEDCPHITLTVPTASTYFRFSQMVPLIGHNLFLSEWVDFNEVCTFISKINYGSQPLFPFLRVFTFKVWLLILMSIMVLAIISSIENKTKIWVYIWNYFILLFGGSVQSSVLKSKARMSFGVCLMTAYYISIGFTSYLMDYMAMAPPLILLDNIEQLVKTDLKIRTFEFAGMSEFARAENPELKELSRAINNTLITFEVKDWKTLIPKLALELKSGKSAYADFRLRLIFDMVLLMKYDEVGENEPKLSDLLHISEDSGGLEPYFLIMTDLSEQWISDGINFIIISTRESGIYRKWSLDVLEHFRSEIGTIDKKPFVVLFEFSELQVSNILDILYITCLGLFLSILTLLIEISINQ